MSETLDYFDIEETLADAAIDTSAAEQIASDEGIVFTEYQDTRGIWTVGIGHNLDVPLSKDAVLTIYADDIQTAITVACNFAGDVWAELSPKRKAVLVNMAFNLGEGGLNEFIHFRSCLQRRDYEGAASQMLQSEWAAQVGARATRLATIMRNG